MAEIANAWISIIPDTSKIAPGVKKALGQAEAPAAQAGTSMGKKISSGVTTSMKVGALGAGAAIGGILGTSIAKGFGRLNAVDQAKAKFEGLGNSAKQIDGIMNDVSSSVKGTAFSTADAANVAAMAMASGAKPGEELQRVLRLVGDSAAFAGANFGDLGPVFTEAMSMGKVTGETLAQMRDNSIPAIQALSEELGVSAEEVQSMASKGEISFEQFASAMENYIGGQALKSGDTFKGALDNMGAAMGRFGEKLVAPAFAAAPALFGSLGGMFDEMTTAVEPAMERIGGALTPAMERLGSVIETKITPAMGDAAGAVADFVADLIVDGLDSDKWGKIGEGMGKIADAAVEAWPSVSSLAGSLTRVTASISVATWQAFGSVLNAVTPIITTVLVPILEKLADTAAEHPGIVQTLVTGWMGMKMLGTVTGPIGKVVGALGKGGGALKAFGGALKTSWTYAGQAAPRFGALGKVGLILKTNIAAGAKAMTQLNNPLGAVSRGVAKIAPGVAKLGKALGSGLVKSLQLVATGFKMLTAAMIANPMIAIVAAVTAVGVALWAFFTKTEVGRQMWQSFMSFLSSAWTWIQQTAVNIWGGIANFFSGVWNGIVTGATTAWTWLTALLSTAWNGIVTAASTIWNGLVDFFTMLWQGIVEAATIWWTNFTSNLQTIWSGITGLASTIWNGLGEFFSSLWTGIQTVATTVWNAIVAGIQAIWNGLVAFFTGAATVITTVLSAGWNALKAVASAVWNGIKTVITVAWQAAVAVVQRVWTGLQVMLTAGWNALKAVASAVWNGIKAVVTGAMNGMRAGVTNAVNVIKNGIQNFVNTARSLFNQFVSNVQQIPGKIKAAFSGAASWLRDAGRNIIQGLADGIRSAGGWIVDAIKSLVPSSLHRFLPFADGGFFFANGGVREDHTAHIAPAGAWRVFAEPETGGEAYIPLSPMKRRRSTQILATVADKFGLSLSGKDGQPVPATAVGKVRATGRAFANGGITNPHDLLKFAQGQNVGGKQAPRSLEGAAYVWGGGLTANWGDCSGAMSGLAAAVTGEPIQGRKFATGSEGGWLSSHGFKSGLGSGARLAIGLFNGGPWGGHTSGTIYFGDGHSTNVEMGGGRGNGQIGGAAAGANHSQYTDRYYFPLKGAGARGRNLRVTGTSTEGVTVESEAYKNETIDWGTANDLFTQIQKDRERSSKLARFRAGLFDTGGVLPHNTVALNRSGKPEVVVNNNQLTAINKLANNVGALVPELAALVRSGQIGGATRALGQTVRTGEYVAAAGLSKDSALVDAAKNVHVMFKNVIAMATTMKVDDYIALGEKLGLTIVTDLVKGVAGAYTKLEDSWVAQVDAADGLKQAEDNLVKARKNYADVVKKDGANSDAAKSAKKELTKAELDLADARSVVTAAAAATGHAEVAMVIEIIDAVVSLVDQITSAVFKARTEVFKAVSSMLGAISEFSELVQKQRNVLTGLRLDVAAAELEVANAGRKLRIAQMDGARAQLEAIATVAEAQAAFDAQRRADAALALADYTDLSLAFDRFRWAMKAGLDESMIDMAAWSDESHALWAELMAAQIGQQIAEKTAQITNLKAAYDHTKAVLDLANVTRDLGVASEKLAVMTGVAFGYDTVQASVGQRYAQLAQEKAEIEAGKADAKNWLNPAAWFTYYPQANRRIEQINAEMAEIAKMDEFKSFDQATLKEIDKLLAGAGALGFFGGADQIANLVNWSALGDAGRALDKVKWQTGLIDAKSERDKLAAEIAEKQNQIDYEKQLAPLETLLESLQAQQGSEKTWAEYWRTEDAGVREALKALAQFQADSADGLKQIATNPTVVNISMSADKTAYSPQEVQEMIAEFNKAQTGIEFRVQRLESPAVSAAAVSATRRVG